MNPFIDVADVPMAELTDKVAGLNQLNSVQSIQIGSGKQAFHGDNQGIWLGGNTFSEAPFAVDMYGNITLNSDSTHSSLFIWMEGDKARIVLGKVA